MKRFAHDACALPRLLVNVVSDPRLRGWVIDAAIAVVELRQVLNSAPLFDWDVARGRGDLDANHRLCVLRSGRVGDDDLVEVNGALSGARDLEAARRARLVVVPARTSQPRRHNRPVKGQANYVSVQAGRHIVSDAASDLAVYLSIVPRPIFVV